MSLALEKASKLKPEIRLAQAVSHFEADLSPQQKTELHAYRQQMLENPPDPSDVMRLTAQVDRLASRKGCRRCFGPRFTNFLQAVQQFAALGDVIVGGSQNIIACGVWSLLLVNFSSYLEKLSALLMVAGRSAPRHQSIAVLYPRSTHLQSHLFEYYVVVVRLCHKLLKFTQRSTLGQLAVGLGSLDINIYQAELEQWANAIKEETSILMAKRIEGEAQENWRFRALSTKISASTSQLQRWKMNQRVLASLSMHDFEKLWKQTRKLGNTTLFNRNTAYQDWKGRGDSCTLVYTGKLGCGKSILLANMVDDLNLHTQNKATRVAYFFTRHDTRESLEARTIIGSVAWQFLRMNPNLDLTGTAKSLDMRSPTLDVKGIVDLLQHTLPADFKAYVVLDGIDDCDDTEREQLMQHLRELQVTFKVLLCISHRVESNSLLKHYSEILAAVISTSIPDNNPDIEEFIEAELESCIQSQKLVLRDPRLILEIQDALQAGSKGMFLWTALQIDSLCYMKTDDTIRQALRDLPKDLSETFSRILNRSRHLGEPYQKRILEFVTAAQRPLTAEELGEAISVVPGDTTWNPAKVLNDVYSVLTCCGSLLIVDEEDFTIRLVHHSVKQFLLDGDKASETAITKHGAKRTMSETIITYLNYGIFDTQISTVHSSQVVNQSPMPKIVHSALGSSSTVSNLALRFLKSRKQPDFDMNKVLRETREEALGTDSIHQHHFRSYTRLYWIQHILDLSDLDPVMYRLLLRLLRGNEVDVNATGDFGRTPLSLAAEMGNEIVVRALLESGKVDVESRDRKLSQTLLSWAAINGHQAVVKLLLDTGKVDVNWMDSSCRTPLSWAAENGHEAVVKLLLETGKVDLESKDKGGLTPLFWAAMNGHETVVKLLLDTGKVDVNWMDSSGQTPLSWAAQRGHEAVVKLLVETGKVDTESKDEYGQTPLSRAAIRGHKAVVQLLLETGKADVESRDNSWHQTPLSCAAENGHEAVVKLLLETGKAEVESSDRRGQTPLSWAAQRGHEAVVKLLLETGKAEVESRDKYGQTPLFWAAMNGHETVVKLLLDTGKVDVNWMDSSGQTPLSWAAENGHEAVVKLLLETGKVDLESKDKGGLTPLFWAAMNGHETVVKLLLDTGKVDVNWMDSSGQTPLSWAAQRGHEAVVKLLVETGKVDTESKDEYGQTPLSRAAIRGHKAVVQLLLETGKADVESRDNSWHQTPLSCAAENGHEAVVKLLLETGKAEVESSDRRGQTPLSWAAQRGHEAVVKLLLETGKAEVESRDKYGQTPLFWAAMNGHETVVKLLLDTGKVDVNWMDSSGQTPLSWAAENGHEAVVKLLLETGKVDLESKDKGGLTPLFWAAMNGHETVVKLLLDTGKVDVNWMDSSGQTPLSWAAQRGHEAVVKLLVETGKVDTESKDEYGQTPLSRAAIRGHKAVVQLLLETGKADVESRDNSWHQTPLSCAAENGHEAVVKLLLETGKAEVESSDRRGQTPLSWAAQRGHEAVVKLLLETGKAEVESRDKYGQTPLFWAANKGHETVVKLLLDTGKVDVNWMDSSCRTPLSWAAENGYEAVVKLLLETGKVDLESKDKGGLTPLFWAAMNGHETVVKLLLETDKVDVKSRDYRAALSKAKGRGYKGVVTLLESYIDK